LKDIYNYLFFTRGSVEWINSINCYGLYAQTRMNIVEKIQMKISWRPCAWQYK